MRVTRLGWLFALVGLALVAAACSPSDSSEEQLGDDAPKMQEFLAEMSGTEWSGFEVKTQNPPGRDPEWVTVEYRGDPVDVSGFLSDSDSNSFVRDVWYDFRGQYLVVSLEGTNYHYCGVGIGTYKNWTDPEYAQEMLNDPIPSMGPDHRELFYLEYIKGNYDCRTGPVPDYDIDGAVVVAETTTTTTTSTVPPVEWPQSPETWMILATQDYLADWSQATRDAVYEDDYIEVGDLTAMGRFWLERDRHPSLSCTESQIRDILGSTKLYEEGMQDMGSYTQIGDVESMQVIGYEPGLGFLLTYQRDVVWTFEDGYETTMGPETSYVFLDPDLGTAFGPWAEC